MVLSVIERDVQSLLWAVRVQRHGQLHVADQSVVVRGQPDFDDDDEFNVSIVDPLNGGLIREVTGYEEANLDDISTRSDGTIFGISAPEADAERTDENAEAESPVIETPNSLFSNKKWAIGPLLIALKNPLSGPLLAKTLARSVYCPPRGSGAIIR